MTTLDPVTLEVMRNALPAISDEMSFDLQRTSYNMMIYEVQDYCTALLDVRGDLISQNIGGVSHFVADLGVVIRDGIKRFGVEGYHAGDVIMHNHQATAGQHLNNVVAYTPVRIDGTLAGFFAVLVHWIDVGGAVPGSCQSTTTTDVWQEGVQYPALKLVAAGRRLDDLFRLIAINSRFPRLLLGDLEAQLGGCVMGRDLIAAILRKYVDWGGLLVLARVSRNSRVLSVI